MSRASRFANWLREVGLALFLLGLVLVIPLKWLWKKVSPPVFWFLLRLLRTLWSLKKIALTIVTAAALAALGWFIAGFYYLESDEVAYLGMEPMRYVTLGMGRRHGPGWNWSPPILYNKSLLRLGWEYPTFDELLAHAAYWDKKADEWAVEYIPPIPERLEADREIVSGWLAGNLSSITQLEEAHQPKELVWARYLYEDRDRVGGRYIGKEDRIEISDLYQAGDEDDDSPFYYWALLHEMIHAQGVLGMVGDESLTNAHTMETLARAWVEEDDHLARLVFAYGMRGMLLSAARTMVYSPYTPRTVWDAYGMDIELWVGKEEVTDQDFLYYNREQAIARLYLWVNRHLDQIAMRGRLARYERVSRSLGTERTWAERQARYERDRAEGVLWLTQSSRMWYGLMPMVFVAQAQQGKPVWYFIPKPMYTDIWGIMVWESRSNDLELSYTQKVSPEIHSRSHMHPYEYVNEWGYWRNVWEDLWR